MCVSYDMVELYMYHALRIHYSTMGTTTGMDLLPVSRTQAHAMCVCVQAQHVPRLEGLGPGRCCG